MANKRFIIGVLIALAIIVIAVVATTTATAGVKRASITKPVRSTSSLLGKAIPITYGGGVYRAEIVVPSGSSGRVFRPMLDTGSPSMNIPNGLSNCGSKCVATGQTQTVKYADGSSDSLTYVRSPVSIGGNDPVSLVFGGTKSSTGANSVPVWGLMSLKNAVGGVKGASVLDQLGARAMTLDLRKTRGALTFWGGAPPTPAGTKVLSASLLSDSGLWASGVDSAGDFYAVSATSPDSSTLTTLIIDTGSTYSHLPTKSTGNVTLKIGTGSLAVMSDQVTTYDQMNGKLGVIGLSALKGHVLVFDRTNGLFAMYR